MRLKKMFLRFLNSILPNKYYFDYSTAELRDKKNNVLLKGYYPLKKYGYFANKLSNYVVMKRLDKDMIIIYDLSKKQILDIITPEYKIYNRRDLIDKLFTHGKNYVEIDTDDFKEVYFNNGVRMIVKKD